MHFSLKYITDDIVVSYFFFYQGPTGCRMKEKTQSSFFNRTLATKNMFQHTNKTNKRDQSDIRRKAYTNAQTQYNIINIHYRYNTHNKHTHTHTNYHR